MTIRRKVYIELADELRRMFSRNRRELNLSLDSPCESVGQWVEHLTSNQSVAASIPVTDTEFFLSIQLGALSF